MVRCFGIYGPLVHKAYRAEVPPRIFKNKKLKLMSKGRGAVTDKRTPPPILLKNYFVVFLVVTRCSLPVVWQEFRSSSLPPSSDYPC